MPELNLFSIPAGASFLEVLAEAMLDGRLGAVHDPADPAAMARATLYLPTRRAARAFTAILAEKLGGRPLLLPRIVPLGDVDEAETALIGSGAWPGDRLVPIEPLQRRMLLTRLVDAWGRSANRSHLRLDPSEPSLVPATLAEAYGLAGDLAALLDQMQTEDVPVEKLAGLDAARFDRVWQLNASFLAILGEAWPRILADQGAVDPAEFRNRMLAAERARLLAGGARGPIIAAGSTGTVPATARLLSAIARVPNGAVVLPGIDLGLDERAWNAIGREPAPSHPQAALHHLLETLGAERADVRELATPDAARHARGDLLREAMLPASVTELWASLGQRVAAGEAQAGFAGLRIVEAGDEREEALAVAIALRETLERPQARAALVTPDRGLAERVAVELARWGVEVDRIQHQFEAAHLSSMGVQTLQSKEATLLEEAATTALVEVRNSLSSLALLFTRDELGTLHKHHAALREAIIVLNHAEPANFQDALGNVACEAEQAAEAAAELGRRSW